MGVERFEIVGILHRHRFASAGKTHDPFEFELKGQNKCFGRSQELKKMPTNFQVDVLKVLQAVQAGLVHVD